MPGFDLEAMGAAAGPMQVWVLPALLGLGLASATGLRTFLPLLMLALAARFEVFDVRLIDQMDWLVSWPAIAAGSVFWAVDPAMAAVAGLIVGAPAALAFNAAQTGVRVGSTATTGGLGNPVVSLIEDVLAFFTVIVAFLAPIVVPVLLIVLAIVVFRLARRLREGRATRPV